MNDSRPDVYIYFLLLRIIINYYYYCYCIYMITHICIYIYITHAHIWGVYGYFMAISFSYLDNIVTDIFADKPGLRINCCWLTL